MREGGAVRPQRKGRAVTAGRDLRQALDAADGLALTTVRVRVSAHLGGETAAPGQPRARRAIPVPAGPNAER